MGVGSSSARSFIGGRVFGRRPRPTGESLAWVSSRFPSRQPISLPSRLPDLRGKLDLRPIYSRLCSCREGDAVVSVYSQERAERRREERKRARRRHQHQRRSSRRLSRGGPPLAGLTLAVSCLGMPMRLALQSLRTGSWVPRRGPADEAGQAASTSTIPGERQLGRSVTLPGLLVVLFTFDCITSPNGSSSSF